MHSCIALFNLFESLTNNIALKHEKWLGINKNTSAGFCEALYEPRYEKTGFLHMRIQRRRSASRNREADQRLCFRYTDSTIPLLPIYTKFQASSHLQPDLCGTWSKTPKTGFLTTRIIYVSLS